MKALPIKYNQLFIDNKFVDAFEGSTFETVDPRTNTVICHVAEGRKSMWIVLLQRAKHSKSVRNGERWMHLSWKAVTSFSGSAGKG